MKVLVGWSAELEHNRWAKFDVELDEADLQRLKFEHFPEVDVTQVKSKFIFSLLQTEAEIYAVVDMLSQGGSVAELTPKLGELKAAKADIISRIKT